MTLHWIALIKVLALYFSVGLFAEMFVGLIYSGLVEVWVMLRGNDPVQSIDTNHLRRKW